MGEARANLLSHVDKTVRTWSMRLDEQESQDCPGPSQKSDVSESALVECKELAAEVRRLSARLDERIAGTQQAAYEAGFSIETSLGKLREDVNAEQNGILAEVRTG